MSNSSSKILIIVFLQSIVKPFAAKQFHKFHNLFTFNLKRKKKGKSDFLFIAGKDIVLHFVRRLLGAIEGCEVILHAVCFKLIFG